MRSQVWSRVVSAAVLVMMMLAGISPLLAQQSAARITQEINASERTLLKGSCPPLARTANDKGTVRREMQIGGINLVFNRSAEQEASLAALIAQQQDPSSPLYHHWLTPDEFAASFGMSDSDLAKVEAWLQEQGFAIDRVAQSRNSITFSGTAGQVKSAFGTELHYYSVDGEMHFAPSSDLSVPAALGAVVQAVSNLSTFRPKPRIQRPRPNFTSSQSGNDFLTPKDVATIYDINPAYTAGYTGAGQSIAVVGQSSVALSDIENFQSALGISVKDPSLVLVPSSGGVAEFTGDESESDLDLEYAGALAPGASIYFVYVGDDANSSVWDSITYAVDMDIAPVISSSYGICETALSNSQYSTLQSVLAQAALQGQSFVAPSGDAGSTDCSGLSGMTTAQQEALAVDFPGSSQYVTTIGGTEFPPADVCAGSPSVCGPNASMFWQPESSSDILSSAIQYIPEQVWNDDSPAAGLGSGGGGASALTPRPSWQAQANLPTGSPNITATTRLLPDISLSASPSSAGYLYCSSDPSIGVTGSCSHGFRDVNNTNLTVAGGTSFGVPIFAGLVAVIDQKENSTGEGVVASTLYNLAANSSTYASAFHDVTSGNNNCSGAGGSFCTGAGLTNYSAATGYDLASGLGSIDFNHLLAAWPASATSSKTASRTTVSAATQNPGTGTNDTITITVAGSGATPTGTLVVAVDGTNVTPAPTLSNGSATYTFTPSVSGPHVITAQYSGNSTYAGSTGTLVLGNGAFRLTATSPTIAAGTSGTSTVTITPQEGYTGSIAFTVTSSPGLTNGCYSLPNATVSGSGAVTATLTIQTNSGACGALAENRRRNNALQFAGSISSSNLPPFGMPVTAGLALLLIPGIFLLRTRSVRARAGLILLAGATLALPGCGGGSSSASSKSNAAKQNYTLTVVGKDTSTSSIAASTTLTVTVD